MTSPATLDELVAMLASLAGSPGEAPGLSELDHGLQCAHELAIAHPGDDELQVAGLVHDIGHRFGDDAGHGVLGAGFVRPVLGERVAALVDLHVPVTEEVARGVVQELGLGDPIASQELGVGEPRAQR